MKIKRVVYRLWHNKSPRGRVGYIGKDTMYPRRVNLFKRSKNKGCPKLYQGFQKYHFSVWKVEILAAGFKSNKSLNKAEIFYIKKFDSINKGYNILKGGDGGPGWRKGRRLSEQTKKKLSEINKGSNHPKFGKKDSLETRKKKSLSAKGNKGNSGKKFSNAHKDGIRKAQQKAWDNYSPAQREKRKEAMRLGCAKRKAAQAKLNGTKKGTNSGRRSGSASKLASSPV